jgi:type III secretory pathway lipoprotein EscJ
MSGMVQLATVGDVAEAEEMQEILRTAGIDSSVEQAPEDDAVHVLVPEADLETAREAIEALTDPGDDLIAES